MGVLKGFSIGERSAWLLLCAMLSAVTLYAGYHLNALYQSKSVSSSANDITVYVGSRVSEVRTIMSSLLGMHYTSIDLDNGELLGYAEILRKQSPYVDALGQFEVVSREQLAEFEQHMSEQGLFDFSVVDIDAAGTATAREDAPFYYPISRLEPMHPGNLRLIGADLVTVPGVGEELRRISASNESLLTTTPSSWPMGGALMMFHPLYLGMHPPETEEERRRQFSGGFWIASDISRMLEPIAEQRQGFDIRVHVSREGGAETLYQQTATETAPVYFSFLYNQRTYRAEWPIDSSKIVITLKQSIGFTAQSLAILLLALCGLLSMLYMFAAHINQQRVVERDRQKNKEAVFAERENAERTLNSIRDAVITLNREFHVVHLNPSASLMLQLSDSDVVGKPVSSVLGMRVMEDSAEPFVLETALEELERGGDREFDIRPLNFSTPDTVFRLSLVPTITSDSVITGYILVLRDVSKERKLNEELEFQANHDALTGCTNRFYFEHRLGELIDDLPRSQRKHAICYMDLDQFKVVNDTCGHGAGDSLLKELTENMSSIIRKGDVLSRLGGDEFGLIIVDAEPEHARELINKMHKFFQNYVFHFEDKAFAVRASMGVVFIDSESGSLGDVLSAADIACYEAKDAGRNGVCFYSEESEKLAERSSELSWLPHLQTSLQRDDFHLYVQPVAAINDGSGQVHVTHFEFLLRLLQAPNSVITPWQFVKAAERYDLMRDIDRWVIKNALNIIAELPADIARDFTFSINLSGQSAADPTFIGYIEEQFTRSGVPPSQVWFELTETAAISHFSVANDLFRNIRSLGAKVALDDFGSGLSSFGYLKNLPVDIIKIDGQFVRNVAENSIDREMVRAIHQVGQAMGIRTVAEFVESEAIVEQLKLIGVDYAQGYHIGKPCPVEVALGREHLVRAA